jgi:hypothetical protein
MSGQHLQSAVEAMAQSKIVDLPMKNGDFP